MELRNGYQTFVRKLLELSGTEDSEAAAERIMALETRLAEHHWDNVRNRNVDERYNKLTNNELRELLSNLDVDAYFNGLGSGMQDSVIVSQPLYFSAFNEMFQDIPGGHLGRVPALPGIDELCRHAVAGFIDANFEFYGKTLQGREEQLPRWKRAINSINRNLGELLGQLYVERHFPTEAKERMVDLVNNLTLAYEESINNLDWMSDETKQRALEKLGKFTPKIGYPTYGKTTPIWKCRPTISSATSGEPGRSLTIARSTSSVNRSTVTSGSCHRSR